MEVGDYVRTKDGKIFKWKKIYTTSVEDYMEHTRKILFIEDEIKSSPNIMDLIKEMDLIKYRIHGDLYVSEVQGHAEFNKYKLHIEYSDTIINLEDLDIVSIVTHEQFERMQYNLESEVN